MPSACGVSWSGTSSGKLEESSIPDDDFESHYLNAGDTKSDSSFPVVDGDGNLRSGNVNSAWDLRGQGDGVSEECLRKLDNAFDENVLPETAYENNTGEPIKLSETKVAKDGTKNFGMNLEFSVVPEEALGDGFNRWGVRENDDGSIDVRFNAMEPGLRKGVEITPEFLRKVSSHEYDRIPIQLDHSKSQRANVGFIDGDNVKFSDYLQIQGHFPNTGSSVKQDIIADFTHEPPAITDISVGLHPDTVEVEPPKNRDDKPRFVDGRIREFSLTPFPAGYENGGITPEFSRAVEEAALGVSYTSEAQSKLLKKPHALIKR